MRLGDLDKLWGKLNTFSLNVECFKHDSEEKKIGNVVHAIQGYIKKCVSDAPTIDPETLPIVKELRANIAILEKIIERNSNPVEKARMVKLIMEKSALEHQLSKVTAERDAALTRIKELERCGKWDDSLDGITPYCSVCGCTHNCLTRKPLYCPNCGAKMDLNGV